MFGLANCLKLVAARATPLLTENGFSLKKAFVQFYSTPAYKSSISLDKLFPKVNIDPLANPSYPVHNKANEKEEAFSGIIPIDKLKITYKTSSKPGGQHVNKTATSVEIRFHLDSADWIPKWIREKIKEKNINQITKEGYFIVKSERTRKTLLNQADCLEQIRRLIFEASQKPRGLTEDEKLKMDISKKIADGRRLVDKRKRSEKRNLRRHPVYDAKYDFYEKY